MQLIRDLIAAIRELAAEVRALRLQLKNGGGATTQGDGGLGGPGEED